METLSLGSLPADLDPAGQAHQLEARVGELTTRMQSVSAAMERSLEALQSRRALHEEQLDQLQGEIRGHESQLAELPARTRAEVGEQLDPETARLFFDAGLQSSVGDRTR